jgi:hypothetical protein
LVRRGLLISDDRRVYSDEEFALILRKAAELAEPADPSSRSPAGLTLAEMKAAAAQVGIEPALVERAARLMTAHATAAPSFLERVLGGPARYSSEAHYPILLDEASVARLMSAIRIGVGRPGEGHSSALGLTWRSSDDGGGVLGITVQIDHENTTVKAELDRRAARVVIALMTGVASVMAFLFGGTVADGLFPGYGLAGALLGAGGVLAVGRSYWGSSTRAARDRLSRVMDSVSKFLSKPGNVASASEAAAPTTESDPAAN